MTSRPSRHQEIDELLLESAVSPSNCESRRATTCRASSAAPAARSTIRIRGSSPAACRIFEDRILMCRRAIEPRRGFWTFPAGFMENGETIQDAARRESVEEALADVEIGSLLSVVHVLHADQVHVTFRAQSAARRYSEWARRASRWCCATKPSCPWPEIAFLSVDFALAALRRGPSRRRRGASFHDDRPAPPRRKLSASLAGRPCFGRIRALARARSTRCDRDFAESADDLRRHRKLHQVQVHGLRGGLPGRLFPRGPELPGHRSRGVHRLHAVRAGVPGRGDLLRGRNAGTARSASRSSTPSWQRSGR